MRKTNCKNTRFVWVIRKILGPICEVLEISNGSVEILRVSNILKCFVGIPRRAAEQRESRRDAEGQGAPADAEQGTRAWHA